jgi:hypothetical protein
MIFIYNLIEKFGSWLVKFSKQRKCKHKDVCWENCATVGVIRFSCKECSLFKVKNQFGPY